MSAPVDTGLAEDFDIRYDAAESKPRNLIRIMPAEEVAMETNASTLIIQRYFDKLTQALALDVALVGAGPSAPLAAHDLRQHATLIAEDPAS